MAIRWDPLLVRALAHELEDRLAGERVRALHLDGVARRVTLHLRAHTLVLELHPNAGWVSLLDPVDPPADARPLPTQVRSVTPFPDESALVFALPRVRGRDEGVELVVEWVGNRWNALVVGHRSRIIRHILTPREEHARSLTVGALYHPPAGTDRGGVDGTLSREEWEALRGEGDAALLRGVAFLSSLNLPAFAGPEGYDRWKGAPDPGGWDPVLLRTPRGILPYPIPIPGVEGEQVPSLLEGFRRAREATEGEAPAALLVPSGLLARGEGRLRTLEKRLRGLERELEGAEDPEPIRAVGDLLLARFGELPTGADRAVLTDFHGNRVEVELDPALPPHENARRYYDRAARLERARTTLPKRIEEARAEVEEWAALLDRVRAGEEGPDALADRLGPGGGGGRKGGGGEGPILPYTRYRSSGGLEIRVGRGARRNDELTFHHSAPGDVWLHVRQSPGAHVILRWNGEGNPPERDLAEAATLAALHSDARHAGTVPVDWTFRRYVRKPRKGAAGAVIPDRVKTVFVEPDPAVKERLAVR